MRYRFCLPPFVLLLALTIPWVRADEHDRLTVGVQPDGRIVVPTNQILQPAGTQVTFPGRPVDLLLLEDGKTLVVKNMRSLEFLDLSTNKLLQTLPLPAGSPRPGFSVVGLAVHGGRIYASDAQNQVRIAERGADGRFAFLKETLEPVRPQIGGLTHPSGLALLPEGRILVASTRGNNVQLINLTGGKVEQVIPVGVAPFAVAMVSPTKIYVSNWGGNPPRPGDAVGLSSGSPVRIDPRTSVANHGTLSVLGIRGGQWEQIKTVEVGLHPSGLLVSRGGTLAYVANAASDTVSVVDTKTDTVIETIRCRPEARLPFGSGSNALALSPDGGTLYVANGTNNCLAVVRLGRRACNKADAPEKSSMDGLIPTGWYPGAIVASSDGKRLFVANIKGHGSLSQPRPKEKGMQSHDHLGSVSLIEVPNPEMLKTYTARVHANNRLAYSLAGLEKPRSDARPLPVPARHGEPSLFKHVIYIIKENRTYDQVFGDMKEGRGDPRLCIFGEEVTPNHHKLAREFTLFDNFYCSGVLSADGHTWVNEAYVSDYLERSFGSFTRSYPDDGTDPLAYVPTGFLWNNALSRKKTIRNYGEYIRNDYVPEKATWKDWYGEYLKPGSRPDLKVICTATVDALKPYTHRGFPWFPLLMSDVARARLFLNDLKDYEAKGVFPHLVYLTLPCDHTEGTSPEFPTPRAMVADNDLALGQVVEAVSKSKFWKDTCIMVVEDDPQNGFDHIDAHRTVALVISPYTKRGYVDRTNYNQTGMVKTIELMLGLPPMNQLDLSATAMRDCFSDQADLRPYTAVPNKIPLDEMNPPIRTLRGKARMWAEKSLAMNFREGDKADEDTLNRILWHSVRGVDTPYPEEFAGKREEADGGKEK